MGKSVPKPPDGFEIIIEYIQWRRGAYKAALNGDRDEVERLIVEFEKKLYNYRKMIDAE